MHTAYGELVLEASYKWIPIEPVLLRMQATQMIVPILEKRCWGSTCKLHTWCLGWQPLWSLSCTREATRDNELSKSEKAFMLVGITKGGPGVAQEGLPGTAGMLSIICGCNCFSSKLITWACSRRSCASRISHCRETFLTRLPISLVCLSAALCIVLPLCWCNFTNR